MMDIEQQIKILKGKLLAVVLFVGIVIVMLVSGTVATLNVIDGVEQRHDAAISDLIDEIAELERRIVENEASIEYQSIVVERHDVTISVLTDDIAELEWRILVLEDSTE